MYSVELRGHLLPSWFGAMGATGSARGRARGTYAQWRTLRRLALNMNYLNISCCSMLFHFEVSRYLKIGEKVLICYRTCSNICNIYNILLRLTIIK